MALPSTPSAARATAAPKLAIWHFLLWMACVAAIAGWQRARSGDVSGSLPIQGFQLALGLTYSVLAGLVAAGLLLAGACVIARRRYYPVTAGHWLLVVNGLVLVLSEASNFITDLANPGIHWKGFGPLVRTNSFFLMACVNLVAAFAIRDRWPWRIVFVGYAVTELFWSVVNAMRLVGWQDRGQQWFWIGIGIQWPAHWVMLSVILVLSAVDLYRRTPRDWMHWTGIGYVASWEISQCLLQLLHGLLAP